MTTPTWPKCLDCNTDLDVIVGLPVFAIHDEGTVRVGVDTSEMASAALEDGSLGCNCEHGPSDESREAAAESLTAILEAVDDHLLGLRVGRSHPSHVRHETGQLAVDIADLLPEKH